MPGTGINTKDIVVNLKVSCSIYWGEIHHKQIKMQGVRYEVLKRGIGLWDKRSHFVESPQAFEDGTFKWREEG